MIKPRPKSKKKKHRNRIENNGLIPFQTPEIIAFTVTEDWKVNVRNENEVETETVNIQ